MIPSLSWNCLGRVCGAGILEPNVPDVTPFLNACVAQCHEFHLEPCPRTLQLHSPDSIRQWRNARNRGALVRTEFQFCFFIPPEQNWDTFMQNTNGPGDGNGTNDEIHSHPDWNR
jgi:hypothetical protein